MWRGFFVDRERCRGAAISVQHLQAALNNGHKQQDAHDETEVLKGAGNQGDHFHG
jgi:hypothetical protein